MTAEVDPEVRLALAYVPAARRPALEALWRLDAAFGAVLITGREPMISRIRLAWWRESLERLDREPPPAEPVLEAVALHLLPAGLTGAGLAELEAAWAALVEPGPLSEEDFDLYARARGGRLFGAAARLLGAEAAEAPEAAVGGEAWALVDLARRSSNEAERSAALAAARLRGGPKCWPTALRPIGMLAILARRDAELGRVGRQGSPGRVLRMLHHRLTGR